jgi:hypothetical protein
MVAKVIQEQTFVGSGRGPELSRWVHEVELHLPNSETGFVPDRGSIVGAEYESSWVIFHRLQVMQCVPDEVHTYWHWKVAEPKEETGVWLIEDSVS